MTKNGVFNKIISAVLALSFVAVPILGPVYNGNVVIADDATIQIDDNKLYNIQINEYVDYTQAFKLMELVNNHRAGVSSAALNMDVNLLANTTKRAAEVSINYNKATLEGAEPVTGNDRELRVTGVTTAEAAFNEIINSSASNKGIVEWGGFKSIGVGVVKDASGKFTYVLHFYEGELVGSASAPANGEETFYVKSKGMFIKDFTVQSDVTLKVGESSSVQRIVLPVSGGSVELTPTFTEIDDNKIATLDKNGQIMAVAKGEAIMKVGFAEAGSAEKAAFKTVKITVTDDAKEPSGDQEDPTDEPQRPGDDVIEGSKVAQDEFTFDNDGVAYLGENLTLKVKGGSGDGAVEFGLLPISGDAELDGALLIPKKTGMISVIAIKKGNDTYKDAMATMTIFIEVRTGSATIVEAQVETKPEDTQKEKVAQVVAGVINKVQEAVSNIVGDKEETEETSDDVKADKDGAGNYEKANQDENTEENVEVAEQTETKSNTGWMIWLWVLVPVMALMFLIINFARGRLR